MTASSDSRGDARSRRPGMSMGLMVVLAIGIATAVWAGIERVTPDAPPVAEPTTASGITYSQATARAYHEWQEWTRWEQCLEAEGYPGYAHLETEVALAPDVAAHLGIEPATQHPDRPVVDLRESPFWTGAQEDARYDQLMSLEHPDSCWPERTALDVADGRAVAALVEAARGDEAFRSAIAEYAWAIAHPDEVDAAIDRLLASDATLAQQG